MPELENEEIEAEELIQEDQEDILENSENENPENEEIEEDQEDEVIVSIDGEEQPEEEREDKAAPKWVKDLRKNHRETQRENKELKAKLEALTSTEKKPVELGKKPTLEDCEWDEDVFSQKMDLWYSNKLKFDEEQAKVKAEQKKQEEDWQNNLNEYEKKKTALKARDFDFSESFVQDNFSQVQQGMILQGAENPALVVYALGKNQKKAKELADIKDPVKFAFAVAKLETKMNVSTRKASTNPERKLAGSAKKSGSVDSKLEQLRAEARKTGDFTKVNQYKKKLKK